MDIGEYMIKKMIDDMFKSGSSSSSDKLSVDQAEELFGSLQESILAGNNSRTRAIARELGLKSEDLEEIRSETRQSSGTSVDEPKNIQFARTQKKYIEDLLGISTDESGNQTRTDDESAPYQSAFGWQQFAPAGIQQALGTRDMEALLETIGSGEFLQAYEMLRGAGAISDAEGRNARAYRSALLAQDEKGRYKLSDERAKSELERLLKIAQDGIDNYEKGLFPHATTNSNTPIEGTERTTTPSTATSQGVTAVPQVDPLAGSPAPLPDPATAPAPVPQADPMTTPAQNSIDLTGMDNATMQQTIDAAPSGTVLIYNGQTKIKP